MFLFWYIFLPYYFYSFFFVNWVFMNVKILLMNVCHFGTHKCTWIEFSYYLFLNIFELRLHKLRWIEFTYVYYLFLCISELSSYRSAWTQFIYIYEKEYLKSGKNSTAKKIWDSLALAYKGTTQVRETKANVLARQYELFKMDDHESIEAMFNRFQLEADVYKLKHFFNIYNNECICQEQGRNKKKLSKQGWHWQFFATIVVWLLKKLIKNCFLFNSFPK